MSSDDDFDQIIDFEEGKKLFGGDEQIFQEMIARFQEMSFDEQMDKLVDSISKKDFKGVYQASHTLKGASSYIGAFKFSDSCKDMQYAGQYLNYLNDKTQKLNNSEDTYTEGDMLRFFLILINEAKRLIIKIQELQQLQINIKYLIEYEKSVMDKYPEYNQVVQRIKMGDDAGHCKCQIF